MVERPSTQGNSGERDDARRELADAHAMVARTHNAVTTLASLLKEVLARQSRQERGLALSSFAAYVLFTVLLGGAFFSLYRARAEHLVGERDLALRRREELADEASALRKEIEARDKAALKASDYFHLVRDPAKRSLAISRYSDIAQERLTPVEAEVLREAVARARAEQVDAGASDGLTAFRGQQWKRAATRLRDALEHEADGPRAAQLRYYYGVAVHKLGDYQEAAKSLELAIGGGAERTAGADARFYLAAALEMLRQLERARAEYVRFADGHPAHPMALTARRKARELAARAASSN